MKKSFKSKIVLCMVSLVACVCTIQGAFANPLHDAAEKGDMATVVSLVNQHPEWVNECTNGRYADAPIFSAIRAGRKNVVKYLIQHGVSLTESDSYSNSMLGVAAYNGQEEIVNLLFEYGVPNINKCNFDRETALHLAIYKGHTNIARLLIEKGADIMACDSHRDTPLHYAVRYRNMEIVQLLIDLGADKNAKNRYGVSPQGMVKFDLPQRSWFGGWLTSGYRLYNRAVSYLGF